MLYYLFIEDQNMNTAIIILFVITMLFTLYIVYKGFKHKNFISKSNAVFFLPLFILTTTLYSLGFYYSKGKYDSISLFECMFEASKAFSFSIKRDYIATLAENNILFEISIITATVLSSYTSLSTILGFAKGSITNFIKLNIRFLSKNTDFVLGCNKNSIEFAKRNKNVIVLIDKSDKNYNPALKHELFQKNIVFVKKSYNPDKISKMLRFKKGKIHFFQFDNQPEFFNKTIDLIKNTVTNEKLFLEFHLLADEDNILFINKKLTEACAKSKNKGRVMALSFNLYSVIGKQFTKKYNYAKFLPSDFLENGLLKPNKNIEVVMFGAGKISNSILKYSLLNNQFVTLENNKFRLNPINYLLFDIDSRAFDNKIINSFGNHKVIELPAKIKTQTVNLKSVSRIQDILTNVENMDHTHENDTFRYFFINVGDSLVNQMISNAILEESNTENCVVFFCVDSKNEIVGTEKNESLIPFGFKHDLLTIDNITDDDNYEEATLINDFYNKLKGDETKFTVLNIVEKLSNFYADINLEFKLNLMGMTLEKNNEQVTKEEFEKIYYGDFGKPKKYSDYFTLSVQNMLRYQEHARWLTYYYLNGYKRMNLDEIRIEDNQIIHKDFVYKKHACLVDYYSLNEFHEYEAKLLMKIDNTLSFEDALRKKETYQYDSILLDNLFEKNRFSVYKMRKF